jgi:excisionase family DNA binding protein
MAQKAFTTQEVADIVGVHKNTVLNWVKTGKVPDARRDWKKYRVWSEKDVQRLIECKNKYMQLSLDINE